MSIATIRKGDLVDVRTADAVLHAVVVSARAHRIAILAVDGQRYSFPKHLLPRVVRPFRGNDIDRELLLANLKNVATDRVRAPRRASSAPQQATLLH